MNLVGLFLIGTVLAFGSVYVTWVAWSTWQEARASAREVQSRGSVVPLSTWLQHGLALLFCLVFLSFAASLCLSIAQGESCASAFEQLKSLTAQEPLGNSRPWGEKGRQGSLCVTISSNQERVTGASLAYIDFDNSDLKQLVGEYPHIHWFILSGTQIDDHAVRILACRENLSSLVLTDTDITDRGVAFLHGHARLQELDLARTAITDRSLQTIGSLPALKHLCLRQTQVTDDGLKALERNTNLLTLDIQETALSDGAVATLASMKSLSFIRIGGSKLSPDGVKRLQHALPMCDIALAVP